MYSNFLQQNAILIAAIGAGLFSVLILFFLMRLRSLKNPGISDHHGNKKERCGQNLFVGPGPRRRSEDRISEAKSFIEIHSVAEREQVQFKLVSTSNMLESLIYVTLFNKSSYVITVSRINWDLWRSGLHLKAGIFTEKVALQPGESREIVLRDVLQGSETADYSIGSQTSTSGYLEGMLHCETEFGKFKKPFTLWNLQFLISEEARLKLKAVMSQNYLDGLTGLLERKFLEDNLQGIIDRNVEHNSLSFAMIDIDNFKQVNDKHGHLAGDEVIQTVCEIIKKSIGEEGLCIRYGGDEFAIVLQNCRLEDAQRLLEIVRQEVESCIYATADIRTTISVGIASTNGPVDYKTLIKNADDVLRVSKENGKNRVTINQRRL